MHSSKRRLGAELLAGDAHSPEPCADVCGGPTGPSRRIDEGEHELRPGHHLSSAHDSIDQRDPRRSGLLAALLHDELVEETSAPKKAYLCRSHNQPEARDLGAVDRHSKPPHQLHPGPLEEHEVAWMVDDSVLIDFVELNSDGVAVDPAICWELMGRDQRDSRTASVGGRRLEDEGEATLQGEDVVQSSLDCVVLCRVVGLRQAGLAGVGVLSHATEPRTCVHVATLDGDQQVIL